MEENQPPQAPPTPQPIADYTLPQTPQVQPPNMLKIMIIFAGIILIAMLAGAGYYIFGQYGGLTMSKTEEKSVKDEQMAKTVQPTVAVTTPVIESIFADIAKTYGGNPPWNVLNSREAYQFFPKQVLDLVIANDEIGTNYDENYNPITTLSLKDGSIPVKSSYITYYAIPTVQKEKYNLEEMDVVFPIYLKIYELDRTLTAAETEALTSPDGFTCHNDKAQISRTVYSNEQVEGVYCNTNITAEQKEKLSPDVFDLYYFLLLKERNMIVQIGFNTRYLTNPDSYMQDYLTKLFNSNPSLFATKSQIRTVEQSRKFEEWRHKTFDK